MPTEAILLFVQSILSYYCAETARNFKGASQGAKAYIAFGGFLGGWSYYPLILWSFFVMDWYIPVIVVVASVLFSHLVLKLDSLPLRLIAPAVCIICPVVVVCMFLSR